MTFLKKMPRSIQGYSFFKWYWAPFLNAAYQAPIAIGPFVPEKIFGP